MVTLTPPDSMFGGSPNGRKIVGRFFEKQGPVYIGSESPAIRFTAL